MMTKRSLQEVQVILNQIGAITDKIDKLRAEHHKAKKERADRQSR